MANPEHLEILQQGVEVWNEWRRENDDNFSFTPNFRNADLSRIDLSQADLNGARFDDARLYGARLNSADLRGSYLNRTDLSRADLRNADLSYAFLNSTNLGGAKLTNANFLEANISSMFISDVDLSEVKNIESILHFGPSTIGIDTIYRSKGNVPEKFLRGCGVPDEFITYMRSLTAHPIQFYSCFISYSNKNQLFAERLYADLQNKGVRCWLASEDLKIGEKIRIGIDESIRVHDKLMLVLSKYSVASDWVEQEVETALARERTEKRTVLFPIRLDDTVMKIETGWPALIRNTRNIGDFRKWKNPESYNKAFERLLRDLKASE